MATEVSKNGATPLTRKDFSSDQMVRWCPGCGDYAILSAMQNAMPQLGLNKEDFVFVNFDKFSRKKHPKIFFKNVFSKMKTYFLVGSFLGERIILLERREKVTARSEHFSDRGIQKYSIDPPSA